MLNSLSLTDRELELAYSPLQPQEVLLKLGLLLLQYADLALQFLILRPLVSKVLLKVVFDPCCFVKQALSDLLRLDCQHIL